MENESRPRSLRPDELHPVKPSSESAPLMRISLLRRWMSLMANRQRKSQDEIHAFARSFCPNPTENKL